MKIEFLGHSSFFITTDTGVRILTDPLDGSEYPDPTLLTYKPFDRETDLVTVSHSHADHAAVGHVNYTREVVSKAEGSRYGEVRIFGVKTFHDDANGEKRGENLVFIIEADNLRIAHLGDLGHLLSLEQIDAIGKVDIALIPIGGYYTIDASQAHITAKQLNAKIVVPMHYKTPKCNFPIGSLDDFTDGHKNVLYQGTPILKISSDSLPDAQQIIVLDYSG